MKTYRLIKLRNPFGESSEWRGQFSKDSQAWADIENSQIYRDNEADGVFWLTYGTFLGAFDQVYVSPFDMCQLPRGSFRRKATALKNLSSERANARRGTGDGAEKNTGNDGEDSINSEQFALIMENKSPKLCTCGHVQAPLGKSLKSVCT